VLPVKKEVGGDKKGRGKGTILTEERWGPPIIMIVKASDKLHLTAPPTDFWGKKKMDGRG